MFPVSNLFRASSLASGNGDPQTTYTDAEATIVPPIDSDAVESDYKIARGWYKSCITTRGSGDQATVTFERHIDFLNSKSTGEALVDKFCLQYHHLLEKDNLMSRRSMDNRTCTISLSFFRLLIHSIKAPPMKSLSGMVLMNQGRTYTKTFISKWEAAIGRLALTQQAAPKKETKSSSPLSPVQPPLSSSSSSSSLSSTPQKIVNHSCQVCGKLAKNRCGNCRVIYYCSLGCQSSHWNIHKSACVDKK